MILSDGGSCADGTCTGEGHEDHKGAMPAAPAEGGEMTPPAEGGGEGEAAPAEGGGDMA